MTKDPVLFSMASIINQLGGGVPLGPTNYGALGGIILPASDKQITMEQALSPAMVPQVVPQQIDYGRLAAAMAKMPRPVVGISDICAGLKNEQWVQARTSQR
ncbi:hypothetical protein [Rufibacter hautae]|uniref:Uncharacterized protein n=1 Tax=Rufibacter hautae TaxID=2595005 RepID=A0A5B6TDC7_9BACT|nr:hypothetical protein [Rufibacter hautae]KAA3438469.1 hypothetical protein FOA19_14635 [Rufibacter hautae]